MRGCDPQAGHATRVARPDLGVGVIPDAGFVERRKNPRAGRLLSFYYRLKYGAFAREQRPRDGRRGLLALQIDALAYGDLRRAIRLGYCPTIARLLRETDTDLRRWFCGLP